MEQEHQELHKELRELTQMPSEVRRTAKLVAEALDAHFERENESALPVIGITKELAEDKLSEDFPKALELSLQFETEYQNMLQEHMEMMNALHQFDKVGKKSKRQVAIKFVRKFKLFGYAGPEP